MEKIVVIDDCKSIRSLLTMYLQKAGYEVIDLPNGVGLISILESQSIHLVITDIYMPERDGFETIMDCRKFSKEIKIIVMSGGDHGNFKTCKVLGANYIMQKPFDRKEILNTVRSVLNM